MGVEIERKFLVNADRWSPTGEPLHIEQGYLCVDPNRTVRVRRTGDRACLTVKGRATGLVRDEYEVDLPLEDAVNMIRTLCIQPIIDKKRYLTPADGFTWEIDVFQGENQGLILAEAELVDPEQTIEIPDWIKREVTGDPRYYNSSLIQFPYTRW